MRRLIFTFLISAIAFFIQFAKASNNEKQKLVANKFITSLMNQDFEKCFNMLDKKTNANLNKAEFISTLHEVYEGATDKKEGLELYLTGLKIINGRELTCYSYKYKDQSNKGAPTFLFDVIFANEKSIVIDGIQLKGLIPNSFKQIPPVNKNETLITSNQTWIINQVKHNILGVKIIHFSGGTGIIAAQVEQITPESIDLKTWANNEGPKFAKYLYKDPSYVAAVNKAKELNIKLLPEIGIAFFNPLTGIGYNTLIKETDYKN